MLNKNIRTDILDDDDIHQIFYRGDEPKYQDKICYGTDDFGNLCLTLQLDHEESLGGVYTKEDILNFVSHVLDDWDKFK